MPDDSLKAVADAAFYNKAYLLDCSARQGALAAWARTPVTD